MHAVDESTIRSVVEQIVAQLATNNPSLLNGAHVSNGRSGALGIHGSVDDAVAAAGDAFRRFQDCSLEQRDEACQCIRDYVIENANELGRKELDETGIGRLDHKIEKLVVVGQKSLGVEFLKTDAFSGSNGIALIEYAPFGVIGAITPVTHSLPTLANNAISMLASGNTVVFNAHPSGANIAKEGCRAINERIYKKLGIDNLINVVDPPTIDSAQGLFDHRDVRLILVTGGPAVARAALQSKKRAIVAGPGNPPVVVDETACLVNAAKSIVRGGAYDNNLLCIGEKMVFAVHAIYEDLMQAMSRANAFRLSDEQIRNLEAAVFEPAADGSGKKVLRKQLVGKDPQVIGREIGVNVPAGIEMLYGETDEYSPFVDHEQMMPFVPFVRVPDVHVGIALAKKYEHGYRHTAVMHSRNTDNLTKMGREMDVTIYVQNGPSVAGLGLGGEGYMGYSIATPTGEGVVTPLTLTRQRRSSTVGALRVI